MRENIGSVELYFRADVAGKLRALPDYARDALSKTASYARGLISPYAENNIGFLLLGSGTLTYTVGRDTVLSSIPNPEIYGIVLTVLQYIASFGLVMHADKRRQKLVEEQSSKVGNQPAGNI